MVDVAALVTTAAASRAKHPERALLALLEAWRATRSPELATAIDRIGRTKVRRPLGGGSLKAQTARWTEIAAANDPLDLPRLAAALATGRAQSAGVRISALAQFPDDPRIAAPLATFLAVPPYSLGTAMALATATAGDLLVRIADSRAIAILEPHATRPEIAELVSRLHAAAVAVTTPLDASARTAFATLDAQLGDTRSGEDLLAAIYANPDDDSSRIVYADWLLEQGDTRGELIHLQLAAASAPLSAEMASREAELVRKHERAMLGPLAKATKRRRFRRGFLAACAIDAKNTRTIITASTAREWCTVEELDDVGTMFAPYDLVTQPGFRGLKRLGGASYRVMSALLACSELPRLESLGVALHEPEHYDEILIGLARFPTLVTLSVDSLVTASGLRMLWEGPLGQQLRRLVVRVELDALGAYLAAAAPTSLRELSMWTSNLEFRAERRDGGGWCIALPPEVWGPGWATALGGSLVGQPASVVAEVRLPVVGERDRTDIETVFAPIRERVTWMPA